MRMMAYVGGLRRFVTDVDPGRVAEVVGYFREMAGDAEVMVFLESERHRNVTYMLRERREVRDKTRRDEDESGDYLGDGGGPGDRSPRLVYNSRLDRFQPAVLT